MLGLRHLLAELGLNVEQGDTQIVPAPPTQAGRFMGHAGVEAIKQNLADGYWGNGMRVALGEKARRRQSPSRSAPRRRSAGRALV